MGGGGVNELESRRSFTSKRLSDIRSRLVEAEARVKDRACVYATGSFGRGEASTHSDLDLFIVGKDEEAGANTERNPRSALRRLDEICVKANLIHATRELNFPEFSGDGEYLGHYALSDLIKTLGTRQDDVTNTFTARMLLLLESCPLVGEDVYREVVEEVISVYWRDYEDHRDDFIPAFLTNDILRLWRTFCVNYEAGTDREPPERKAKGKLKNFKLKHSRMITCYSAILFLLTKYMLHRTVTPDDGLEMTERTPTMRLEQLLGEPKCHEAFGAIRRLLERYNKFLEITNASEENQLKLFATGESSRGHIAQAYGFGDSLAEALNAIGGGSASRFYRLLVV
jgi:predicted nucleotidyltransferase